MSIFFQEGLRKTEVRTKFNLILNAYGIAGVKSAAKDEQAARGTNNVFKDKVTFSIN